MSMIPYALRGDARRIRLDALQDEIDALLAERNRLDASPLTADECRARVIASLPGDSRLGWALNSALLSRDRGFRLRVDEPLTLRDLALIMGTQSLADKLTDAAAARLMDLPEPVEEGEYSARLSEIEQDLRDLQEQEEREVLTLFDAGVKAARRENADPSVIHAVWSASQ